jgi:tripartite-type tricarboxylate transporter receptor subunit TctC
MSYWWGIAVPAGTPAWLVSRLNQEIVRAANGPDVRETFRKQGARAVTSPPAVISRRVSEEIQVWKTVIAKAGVKVE